MNKTPFLKRLFITAKTAINARLYRKLHARGKADAYLAEIHRTHYSRSSDGPYLAHPLFRIRLEECHSNIADQATRECGSFDTVAYGDSLMHIPKNEFACVPAINNRALSGSWAHHIKGMIVNAGSFQAAVAAKCKNLSNYVIVGCFGNAFLAGQSLTSVERNAEEALLAARMVHPTSKIIVYGLPPSYNFWVRAVRFTFEAFLIKWVLSDGNAVYVSLDKLGGWLGLFPSVEYSSDSIHCTPKGIMRMDEAFSKAKESAPGSIVVA